MNVIEHIERTLDQIKTSGKPTGEFIYVNKNDDTDSFKTIDEALERGLDLSKYQKREEVTVTKADLLEIIKGDRNTVLTRFELQQMQKFVDFCRGLAQVDDFPKKLNTLNAKINRSKKKPDLNIQLRTERLMLYIRYSMTPQKSFADFKAYNQLIHAIQNNLDEWIVEFDGNFYQVDKNAKDGIAFNDL